MNESLDERLHRVEAELDALAREAWGKGYALIVNSSDGAILYYNPAYPERIRYKIRRRTIGLLYTTEPEPEERGSQQ